MGRTSDWMRYQDHRRRRRRRLARSAASAYGRRYYWVRKLRGLGVPEPDIPDAVSGILASRTMQALNEEDPDSLRRRWRSWYWRNRKRMSDANRAMRERYRSDDAARRDFSVAAAMSKGGLL